MNLKTFRQAAAMGILPEFRLRQMQKEGRCPGVFAGSRFYVDVDRLLAQLDAECAANAANAQQPTGNGANV